MCNLLSVCCNKPNLVSTGAVEPGSFHLLGLTIRCCLTAVCGDEESEFLSS